MSGEDEDSLLNSLTAAVEAEKAGDTEPKVEDKEAPAEDSEKEDTEEAKEDVVADEDADGEPELDDAPAKPTKKSASDTIRALKAERNQERADREKLIAELAAAKALEHEREQRKLSEQSAAERKAQEDRLALLDPQERATYDLREQNKALEHRLNLMEFKSQDNTDRAIFQSKAAHDPLVAKYVEEVEQMRQSDLKKGYAAPREEYLNFIVGREVRKNAAADLSKKKSAASKRIDTATAKPVSARGDVAGSKQGKSEEDRLRGVLI